jgi:hypothetical protein
MFFPYFHDASRLFIFFQRQNMSSTYRGSGSSINSESQVGRKRNGTDNNSSRACFLMASQTRLEACNGSVRWAPLQRPLYSPTKASSSILWMQLFSHSIDGNSNSQVGSKWNGTTSTRNRAWFFLALHPWLEACHDSDCWTLLQWKQHLPIKDSNICILWKWLFSQRLHPMTSVNPGKVTAGALINLTLPPIPTFIFYITFWFVVIYECSPNSYRHTPDGSLPFSTQSSCTLHSKMEATPHISSTLGGQVIKPQPLQHKVFLALTAWYNQPLQHGLITTPLVSPDSNLVTSFFCLPALFSMTLAIMYLTISRSPQLFDNMATSTTMTPVPQVHYSHALHGLHDNIHPLSHPVLLRPHADDRVASYSTPSSIHDGALAILGLPSIYWWTTLCTLMSSWSSNHPLTHQTLSRLSFCWCYSIC